MCTIILRRIRMTRVAFVIGVGFIWSTSPAEAEVPKPLRGIVMGDRHRPIEAVTLDGVVFESIRNFSELPYLLWPADAKQPLGLADDAEAVRAWLLRCSRGLGFDGFEPRFVERFQWLDNDVLSFELVRRGLVLHDARVMAHFRRGTFLGIQNQMDGKMVAIQDVAPADAPAQDEERVYYPVRAGEGVYQVVPATLKRVREKDREIITVLVASEIVETEVYPDPVFEISPREAAFTEYVLPRGSFPDQISVAQDGLVWFSQPPDDFITSLNPRTGVFTQYSTAARGGRGPDGLIVGSLGRIWSGMYYSGSLGWLDTTTNTVYNYAAPYGSAAMAIPVETSDGSIWVTDHQANRISEFDPDTRTWLRSVIMPTPNCWVVQGFEDTDRGQIYFTEYNANKIGRIPLGGSTVTDILTPGGGPAFCVYSDGNVYYSRWNEAGMGVYNVDSRTFTEYNFPVPTEMGGPMWLRPNGEIVFGTRNRGYIMIFDPAAQTFTSLAIPTPNAGLKDGTTVGPDGVIWFTETGVNKVTKLEHFPLKKLNRAP
ncbi:MAG: hypothetical protein IT449_02490 [Phycisphaerales bacterium]|nr:hypothetical protein [Phycisphaerales bacterium]